MAADLRLFVTHIMSKGPTSKVVGSGALASDGSTLTDATKNFVTLGVIVGDVVRLTSPASVDGQAAVVKTVAATVLTFYVPLATGGLVASYRVEAPRQASDVSDDVLRFEIKDYMTDLAGSLVFEVANTGNQYEGLFSPRDPVELWVDDNDADTPSPAFPASTSDTTKDNDRSFIGRIDRIERDRTENGEVLRISARDYAADALDTPVDGVLINCPMLEISPGGISVFPNVVQALQQLYNGADAAALTDLDDDLRAGHCGVMRDRATGRPTLALSTSSAFAGTTTNPTGDVAFATESFFDAFAKIAGICTQVTAGDFVGEPLRFFVNGYTYHPRKQDRTGAGEDDPRPVAGANPGAGNPTIVLKTPAEVQGAALGFSIVEGTNAVALHPLQDSERTRNTITILGVRNDDAPVVMRRRQSASFRDAFNQEVLGRDRYGTLGNVAQARGLFDTEAAEAAATAALIRTRAAKERRTITRTMALPPGRRLAGSVVSCTAPTAGIDQDVGVAGVRHQWDARGLTSEFDLTFIRPGWDRLLAPFEKSARDTIREEIWRAWYVVIMDFDTVDFDLTFKRVDTHLFGDETKETTLFSIANPGQGTYATQGGTPWRPAGFHFYSGLLFILWADDATAGGKWRVLVQVVNAYDGANVLGGDGLWAVMDDGVSDVLFDAATMPKDIWVEAHINASAEPEIVAQWSVYIGPREYRIQRFALRRDFRRVLSKDAIVSLQTTGADAEVLFPDFFIATRDDGHVIRHGIVERGNPLRRNWITHDLSEVGAPHEIQETLLANLGFPLSVVSDRSADALAVFAFSPPVVGPPTEEVTMRMTKRWGATDWVRFLGEDSRLLSGAFGAALNVAGKVTIVPYARMWFCP